MREGDVAVGVSNDETVAPRPSGVDEALRQRLLVYQRNEITEHHIYRKLARTAAPENRSVLEQMAEHELRHYRIWRSHTEQDVAPDRIAVWLYYFLSRVLGFTFGAKLLERWEQRDQVCYEGISDRIAEAEAIRLDECSHEEALLRMLDEGRLRYTGAMVLGLSDALVELTGAAAGLTLALRDTRLIALALSVSGLAAAMSMAASQYLSSKTEETAKNPFTASVYTGSAYLVTVLILVLPFLLLASPYAAMAITLASAVAVIALFNFYVSVAKGESFRRRFLEMAGLSLGVAAVSFVLGLVLRNLLGIEG
jgi:VIT1/CCC1 family predicted Fe2+/Mn2+ transporter